MDVRQLDHEVYTLVDDYSVSISLSYLQYPAIRDQVAVLFNAKQYPAAVREEIEHMYTEYEP